MSFLVKLLSTHRAREQKARLLTIQRLTQPSSRGSCGAEHVKVRVNPVFSWLKNDCERTYKRSSCCRQSRVHLLLPGTNSSQVERDAGLNLWRRCLQTEDWLGLLAYLSVNHTSTSGLQVMLQDAPNEGETLRCVMAGVVAAVLEPPYYPPWVAERVTLGSESGRTTGWYVRFRANGPCSGDDAARATQARHRHLASSVLSAIATLLRKNEGIDLNTKKDLSIFVTLCALCVAETDTEATRLALMIRDVCRAATGCALASYCSLPSVPFASDGPQLGSDSETPREWDIELRWRKLWRTITQEEEEKRSKARYVGLESTENEEEEHINPTLPREEIERFFLAWQLHCCQACDDPLEKVEHLLLQVHKRLDSARFLKMVCGLPDFFKVEFIESFSVPAGSGSLTCTSHHALCNQLLCSAVDEVKKTRSRVSSMDVSWKRDFRRGGWSGASSPFAGRRVHPVTSSTDVQTKLLRHLLFDARRLSVPGDAGGEDEARYAALVREMTALWSLHNTYSLAASVVPPHTAGTIHNVMTATRSDCRAARLEEWLDAVRDGVYWLCAGDLRAVERDLIGSRSMTSQRRLLHGPSISIAARTRRREDVAACIGEAVGMIANVLTLCSDRQDSLPSRRSVPAWRCKIDAAARIRSHKYQLLSCEIPHRTLASLLHVLLDHGYVVQAATLGSCITSCSFLDLRFYSSSVLSSFYHAVRSCNGPNELLDLLPKLYRQRVAVFGRDEECTASSASGDRYGSRRVRPSYCDVCSAIVSRTALTNTLAKSCDRKDDGERAAGASRAVEFTLR